MKHVVLFLLSFFYATALYSQNLEAYINADVRAGFSTNTYLHPFIGEWDQSDSGVFSRLSPSADLYYYGGRFSADFSAGYLFEPIFDDRQNWSGLYGSARLNYRLTQQLSLELPVSANRLSSRYERTSISMLPAITWAPSLFTRVSARAGSSFRSYNGLFFDEDDNPIEKVDRFDVYGLEFERWTSFKWQVRGSVYGVMNQNPVENHSASVALSRVIRQSAGITFNLSLNRYLNNFALDGDGGFIPADGPANDDTQIVEESDQLFRSGVSFSFPITAGLSGNGSVSHLFFRPAVTNNHSDVELSLGVRYRFSASGMFKNNSDKLSPGWENRDDNAVILKVRYRGDGDLFLVGEFNDWDRPGIPLSRQGEQSSRYAALLDLEPGIYEYKILLIKDGEEKWVEFTDETMTVSDGFGGTNGLIFID
jgi:hypothetical protein